MNCISRELAKLEIQRVCFCHCLNEETENDTILLRCFMTMITMK